MSIGTIHGIYTIVFMLTFIAMGIFVFLPRRKDHYDDAASLPFSEEETKDADGSRRPDKGE